MNLTIHRGAQEIGGTCVELQAQNTKILIDFGMPLMDSVGGDFNERELENKPVSQLIKENILYPIKGLYKDTPPQVDAILISHSHKDHYGFLKYANPQIPVYISDGAKKLIDVLNVFIKEEHRITIVNPNVIKDRKPFKIGNFRITPYIVDHSGFEAMSFHIVDTTSRKSIFYSGDFRATGWKHRLFDNFIANTPKNIDYLLMEGTMIGRETGEYPDEPAVCNKIAEILRTTDENIVFSYCSGQNIDRIVTFYKAARKAEALFIVDPYTACVLNAIKSSNASIPQIDWKDIRVYISNYFGKGDIYINKINKSKFRDFIPSLGRRKIKNDDLSKTNRKVLMLMRNSMIPAVSRIKGINGSKLIYSQWKGYVGKESAEAKKFKDFVGKYGLKVEYVHTSGHAAEEKLKEFAKAVKPTKDMIPVHTVYPEKFRILFGAQVKNLPNGKKLEI